MSSNNACHLVGMPLRLPSLSCFHFSKAPFHSKLRSTLLCALTAMLMLFNSLPARAENPAQNISLDERNASLEAVFKKIEQQTGYHFWYEDQLVKTARKVNIQVKNAPLENVLKQCFKDQPLTYTIIEKTIVIKARPAVLQTSIALPIMAADPVTGRVLNDKGEPVPNVTVQVKGTTRFATTNASGQFRIEANSTDILVLSSVGYATQEVLISGQNSLSITLTQNARDMGEVVVTALGIAKETRRLGYATSKVNPEEVTINRTPNLMNALQGKVAGVNITAPSTGPGGSSKIRIRGQSSIGGTNAPLIVINGVPVDNSNFGANLGNAASDASIGQRGGGVSSDGGDAFQSINPDDIESMTVLKGAPAAALYGYRAASGVIMITTKTRGTGKGIGVSYNMNYTSEQP